MPIFLFRLLRRFTTMRTWTAPLARCAAIISCMTHGGPGRNSHVTFTLQCFFPEKARQ
jgi:hypothetical protein